MKQMHWQLHSVAVAGTTHNPALARQWHSIFASLPSARTPPDIEITLELAQSPPAPVDREPDFRQGDLLEYYIDNDDLLIHLPRFGQLQLDLTTGCTIGQLLPATLTTYGVLEDLVAVALSPHLRRHGLYLIHAFAAAQNGRAVLLVGDIGAGKTTTGMALLNQGWRLISNDSPILDRSGVVHQYPGLLAAYPSTFAHFPLASTGIEDLPPRQKHSVAAESIWPGVWQASSLIHAIFFPQIENREHHAVTPLSTPDTLRRLMPHTMEQWDREMMPAHLSALRQVADRAQGYLLHLGPDILAIPDFLAGLLSAG